MDHAHDADSDDDLDERLSRVFEERGIPRPPPRAAAPVAHAASVSKEDGPPARPPVASQTPQSAGKTARPPVTPRPSGRREKTILLAMLGTLAGAFVGVLSMKLFVPRPPVGAGPDIHLETGGSGAIDLVDPPALTTLPPAAAIPPDPFRSLGLPPATPDQVSFRDAPPAPGEFTDPAGTDADPEGISQGAVGASGDSFQRLSATAAPDLVPVPTEPPSPTRFAGTPAAVTAPPIAPSQNRGFSQSLDRFPDPGDRIVPITATQTFDARSDGVPATPSVGGGYVVRQGDTWWTVAESTYGDGRLYKALFAWNRTLDPRVSLAPGTRLELPREEQLRAAWGRLVPAGPQ